MAQTGHGSEFGLYGNSYRGNTLYESGRRKTALETCNAERMAYDIDRFKSPFVPNGAADWVVVPVDV